MTSADDVDDDDDGYDDDDSDDHEDADSQALVPVSRTSPDGYRYPGNNSTRVFPWGPTSYADLIWGPSDYLLS